MVYQVNYKGYSMNGGPFSPFWIKRKGLLFLKKENAQKYADRKNKEYKDNPSEHYKKDYEVVEVKTYDHLV